MKKLMIKASKDGDIMMTKSRNILNAAKKLLDLMEDTPSGFLDANDLGPLYEELIETIPGFDLAIKSGNIVYSKDSTRRIARSVDDFEW